jgi:hypothetical protein
VCTNYIECRGGDISVSSSSSLVLEYAQEIELAISSYYVHGIKVAPQLGKWWSVWCKLCSAYAYTYTYTHRKYDMMIRWYVSTYIELWASWNPFNTWSLGLTWFVLRVVFGIYVIPLHFGEVKVMHWRPCRCPKRRVLWVWRGIMYDHVKPICVFLCVCPFNSFLSLTFRISFVRSRCGSSWNPTKHFD